ncbi:MAG: hypothetical protein AB7O92_23520 [Acidimicrobiia bacterium]
MQELARKLDRLNPDAAPSLREGLDETITINRLRITGTLGRTLATTNPIEPSIDIVRTHAKNVKNWNADRRGHRERTADMRLRWAVARLLAAEQQYRRVNSHRQLPALAAALQPRRLGRTEAVA